MGTKSIVLTVAVLSVGILSPAVAGAATSGPFATSTPVPLTLTDWTTTLSFPQFNPALGTLVSVQIGLSASLSTVLTVTNTSDNPSNGTAKTEFQITVQDAGFNLISPEIDLLSPTFSYSLSGGASTTSGTLTKNGTSSDTYTLAAILTEFTGTGNVSLNASTFTQTVLANTGGNTFASQITNASLGGTVTYEYNPVPEPVSLSLLALGGLAALRRGNRR